MSCIMHLTAEFSPVHVFTHVFYSFNHNNLSEINKKDPHVCKALVNMWLWLEFILTTVKISCKYLTDSFDIIYLMLHLCKSIRHPLY